MIRINFHNIVETNLNSNFKMKYLRDKIYNFNYKIMYIKRRIKTIKFKILKMNYSYCNSKIINLNLLFYNMKVKYNKIQYKK